MRVGQGQPGGEGHTSLELLLCRMDKGCLMKPTARQWDRESSENAPLPSCYTCCALVSNALLTGEPTQQGVGGGSDGWGYSILQGQWAAVLPGQVCKHILWDQKNPWENMQVVCALGR